MADSIEQVIAWLDDVANVSSRYSVEELDDVLVEARDRLEALRLEVPNIGVGVDVSSDGVAVTVVQRQGAVDTVIHYEHYPLPTSVEVPDGMVLVPREHVAQIGFAIDNLIDISIASSRRNKPELILLKAVRSYITRFLAAAPSDGGVK